jgi:hypothetical protein
MLDSVSTRRGRCSDLASIVDRPTRAQKHREEYERVCEAHTRTVGRSSSSQTPSDTESVQSLLSHDNPGLTGKPLAGGGRIVDDLDEIN